MKISQNKLWYNANVKEYESKKLNTGILGDIDMKDLKKGLKITRNRKAADFDGISSEPWKYGDLLLLLLLLHVFTMITTEV